MWLSLCLALFSSMQLLPAGVRQGGPISPAPAAALGYYLRTFHDDFSSLNTIDTNNTLSSEFKWFIKTAWPNAGQNDIGSLSWKTGSVTNKSLLSVGAGGLTISNYTGTGYYSIGTMAYNVAAPGSYVGKAFGGGAYFETKWTANNTCNNSGAVLWPLIWMVDRDFLLGTNNRYTEVDFIQDFPNSNQHPSNDSYLVDWTLSGGATVAHNQVSEPVWPAADNTAHIYGLGWNPASHNGGTGQLLHYYDGTLQSSMTVTYSATTGSTPAASPSNPNGVIYPLDAQNEVILLSAGSLSCAQVIGYVDVWQ
jgi:hypothetical protein